MSFDLHAEPPVAETSPSSSATTTFLASRPPPVFGSGDLLRLQQTPDCSFHQLTWAPRRPGRLSSDDRLAVDVDTLNAWSAMSSPRGAASQSCIDTGLTMMVDAGGDQVLHQFITAAGASPQGPDWWRHRRSLRIRSAPQHGTVENECRTATETLMNRAEAVWSPVA